MSPFINENDFIIVSSIPFLFKKIKINDIVAVSYNNKVLIKRITKIKDKKFFVNGDNQKDSLDSNKFGYISKEQILGKFLFKI